MTDRTADRRENTDKSPSPINQQPSVSDTNNKTYSPSKRVDNLRKKAKTILSPKKNYKTSPNATPMGLQQSFNNQSTVSLSSKMLDSIDNYYDEEPIKTTRPLQSKSPLKHIPGFGKLKKVRDIAIKNPNQQDYYNLSGEQSSSRSQTRLPKIQRDDANIDNELFCTLKRRLNNIYYNTEVHGKSGSITLSGIVDTTSQESPRTDGHSSVELFKMKRHNPEISLSYS